MIEQIFKDAMSNGYDVRISNDSESGRYTVTLHRFSVSNDATIKVFEMSASDLEPCLEQIKNILYFSGILKEV